MRSVVRHRVSSLSLPLKTIYHSVITESMINCLIPPFRCRASAGAVSETDRAEADLLAIAFPCLKIEFHCGCFRRRAKVRFGGNQGEAGKAEHRIRLLTKQIDARFEGFKSKGRSRAAGKFSSFEIECSDLGSQ